MALAYLKYKGPQEDALHFLADIGTATYFRYVLGEEVIKLRVGKQNNIKVLGGEKKSSPLFQLKNHQKILQEMFPITVSKSELTATYKYIQLYSYSSNKRTAPTISRIIRLPVYVRKTRESEFMRGLSITTLNNDEIMQHIEIKNKKHCPDEPAMSKVMFWNTIVGALPGLLKQAAPILGGLLGRGGRASSNNNSAETQRSDEITAKVVAVLEALANNNNTANGTAGAEAEATQSEQQSLTTYSHSYGLEPDTLLQLKPILQKVLSPEAIEAVGDDAQKLFLAIKDAVQTFESSTIDSVSKGKSLAPEMRVATNGLYSKAKVAPALLAAMPLIEKALDPKLIEAIGNQPVKLFKAIGDAVLKMDEQEIKHLEAINPGVDSADDISKLMAGMSIAASYSDELIKFKVLTDLNLEFVGTKTVPFKNKDRVLYSKAHKVMLPFRITTNSGETLHKILPKSVVQVVFRHAKTMKLVFRKVIKLVNVSIEDTISETFLMPQELKDIPVNTELKMEVSYIWKSKSNQNIGVLKSHYIHFIDTYLYDRIGEKMGQSIPFNDSKHYRKLWHKVWEGGYGQGSRWHLDMDVKYFYTLQSKNSHLSRLSTRVQVVNDNGKGQEEPPSRRKIRAKVKSGFEWSLEAINTLMEMQGLSTLDPKVLQVLKASDIAEDFQWVARQHVSLKARDGDTGTLWVYPEMTLHAVYLAVKGAVDDYGQVTELQTKKVALLKPESIHLIGTKSE